MLEDQARRILGIKKTESGPGTFALLQGCGFKLADLVPFFLHETSNSIPTHLDQQKDETTSTFYPPLGKETLASLSLSQVQSMSDVPEISSSHLFCSSVQGLQ